MMQVHTLIFGATFFGISFAKNTQNCLIIDNSEVVCNDFVGCANLTPICMEKQLTADGTWLKKEMLQRKLTDETGKIHIFPNSGILSKYILDHKINILLNAHVVSVEYKNQHYCVRIFTQDGFSEIYADNIVDTLPLPQKFSSDEIYKKYVNAILIGGGEEFNAMDKINIKSGLYGESVLGLEVANDTSYIQARSLLHAVIKNRIKSSKVASFALAFQYVFQNTAIIQYLDESYIWAPSASFGNLLASFDGGAKYALQNNQGWKTSH